MLARLVADFLRQCSPEEVEASVRLILGKPIPAGYLRALEVSYSTILSVVLRLTSSTKQEFAKIYNKYGDLGSAVKELFEKKPPPKQVLLVEQPLTILEVHRQLMAMADAVGPGSRLRKERILAGLLTRSTPLMAKYLVKAIGGEMRHGVREGVLEEAIAKAFATSPELVRRAHMLSGDIAKVARIARERGEAGLKKMGPTVFSPLRPMLAEAANSVDDALTTHGGKTLLEYKLDGARVQIHVKNGVVRVFSRHMKDVTESLPEVVEMVRNNLRAKEAILEGEVVGVSRDGKLLPFQYLMRRFRRVQDIEAVAKQIPVKLFLFDLLYVDGESLIDQPLTERRKRLEEVAGNLSIIKQIAASSSDEASKFFEEAVSEGHEGLVAKQPTSPYTPGIRGKKWLKIKKTPETLDLVIIAAEYGHGYRHKWLSDYYLAARDSETGGFVQVGKTFTGLTDEEIEEMTKRLLELEVSRRGRVVFVQPKVVVEVAFAEIQKSPHYKGGYALRFARITRIRDDKEPEEADTIERVREIFEKQCGRSKESSST